MYAKHTRYRTIPTIDEITSIVQAEIRRHSAVFLVVDALDECPEDGRIRATLTAKLQNILTAAASTATEIRILVTSRFANNVFINANVTEIRATDNDVERLVRQSIEDGLSDDEVISRSIRQNEALKDAIVATVSEKADKMYVLFREGRMLMEYWTDLHCRFLVARLQLNSLRTKTTLRSLREAVGSSPKNLDELYYEAWHRVSSQNSDSRKAAQDALRWLSCSFRQLRAQELRHALATQTGDKSMKEEETLMNFDRLIRSCAGLVTVDKGSQIVRLVHQTAQEFFRGRAGEYFPDAHSQLARTCLTYLCFDEFSQGPYEFESNRFIVSNLRGPVAASRFLMTRLRRYPFLEYAADHWGDHAHGQATERMLQHQILAFLGTPKTLASAVQAQYWNASSSHIWLPSYRSSLGSSNHTPIHVAVSFALDYIVEALLRDVTILDLNAEDDSNKTAFHWAAESGLLGCAQLLLAGGANIRTQDDKSYTPLYKASVFGHASIVKLILEHDQTAKLKKDEISAAVCSNHKLVIQTYITAAPKPAERANLILMESSAIGRPELIEIAVSFGADVNVKDRKGRTALLVAVENGRSTAAQTLINAGASTTIVDEFGRSLLQVAAFSQKVFEERGQNIQGYGDSPAHTADLGSHQLPTQIEDDPCQKYLRRLSHWVENAPGSLMSLLTDHDFIEALHEDDEHPKIIRMLLDLGVDLRIKTPEGETVLHLAVGGASRVKALLEKGAQVLDIDAQDNRGRSALHYAAAIGSHRAMEVLLVNGANITLRDFAWASTLHYAISHPVCVKVAIEGGSSTKEVDSQERTAFHYLAMMEEQPQEVIDQLCRAGVDVHAVDSLGMTASDYGSDDHMQCWDLDETTRWIQEQTYGKRYVLREAAIRFRLRESTAQASRDGLRIYESWYQQAEKNKKWWLKSDDEMTKSTGQPP